MYNNIMGKDIKDIPINEIKSGISDLYSDDDNIEYSVHIASAKRNDLKKRIKNYSEKVIEDDEIKIVFDYPLSGKFEFKFYSENGFTLGTNNMEHNQNISRNL